MFELAYRTDSRILNEGTQLVTGTFVDGLSTLVALAQSRRLGPASPAAQTSGAALNESAKTKCTDNGTYVNSKGQTVPRPENCSAPPKGATARCRDGTYSFSKSRRGTCSHHGGVAKVMTRQVYGLL